ncbi:replication protein [Nitrospinae bacterium AH_259_B05_G02_I21]|nr:replication protein [Nitrospinae bacterium AH_259_B05_G02_I21]MDA2931710.1 replication protein [Nitrospinae bacterium AH-259-F20]
MTSKASPQLEDGFTRIADELLEALIATRLSGEESRIVWAVIRKTYGFNKTMDRIPLSQFESVTGIPRKRCHRLLGQLVSKNVLLKGGEGRRVTYGVQKDYTRWPMSPRRGTITGVPQIGDKVSPKKGTKVSPRRGNSIDSIDIKQYTRGSKYPLSQKFPSDSWQVQLAEEFHEQLEANGNVPSKLSRNWRQQWADVLDECHRLDGKSIEVIRRTVLYPQMQVEPKPGTNFCWADNFTTLNKLRRPLKGNKDETYFDRLERESRRAMRGKKDGTAQGRVSPDDPFAYAYK